MLNDTIKTSEMHFGGGAEKWREINSNECNVFLWMVRFFKIIIDIKLKV